MDTVDTLVIGGGQAGLAMSRCLTDRGREHVVLERGRLAERWRSERWDSLRLLSPNWMTRLPGWCYRGPEPDGFMAAAEVVSFLTAYARASAAPVEEDTAVRSVEPDGERFRIDTDRGRWSATDVVIATGWCDRPAIPSLAQGFAPTVDQVAPQDYRNPGQLADGGVLVVGASATGVQLAAELNAAGRDVTLAVGHHTRLPRRYRGMEILWWLERLGHFDDSIDRYDDPAVARRQPSLQLTGRSAGCPVDLTALAAGGVQLAGRLVAVDGRSVELADDLEQTTRRADDRLHAVLRRVDRYVADHGLEAEVMAPDPPPMPVPAPGPLRLDLARRKIRTVVWATGHRRAYPWLHVPVLDAAGEIRQSRGVTPWPGLYVLGQRFQHHRNSDFIDGVGRDAAAVADHLVWRAAGRVASP